MGDWLPGLFRIVVPPNTRIRQVRTLNNYEDGAMAWARHAIEKVLSENLMTPDQFARNVSERELLTSTAFSGVGAPETADDMIAHAVRDQLRKLESTASPPTFTPVFAIEFNHPCQEELMSFPGKCPKHIFGDMLKFVKPKAAEELSLRSMFNPVRTDW